MGRTLVQGTFLPGAEWGGTRLQKSDPRALLSHLKMCPPQNASFRTCPHSAHGQSFSWSQPWGVWAYARVQV